MYFLDVCGNFLFIYLFIFFAFRTFSAIFDKQWGSFQLPVLLKSRLFQVFRYQRAAVSGEWIKVYTRKTGGGGGRFFFLKEIFLAPAPRGGGARILVLHEFLCPALLSERLEQAS